MNFIIENWYMIVAALAIGCVGGIYIYRYFKMPTSEQLDKVRQWLLYAVTMAEAEFGGGTGKIKLRACWSEFITKFPTLAKVISFETFSALVDEALIEMRKMLSDNNAVKEIVGVDDGESA